MREYKNKKIQIATDELTKALCDNCKKEIQKYALDKTAYVPSEVITAIRRHYSEGLAPDILDFCSLECFLKWAKEESGTFDISFPFDVLNTLASEYARLKSRESHSTDTEIKEDK